MNLIELALETACKAFQTLAMFKSRVCIILALLLWLQLVRNSSSQLEMNRFLPELCVFAEPTCPNTRISFWLYTK